MSKTEPDYLFVTGCARTGTSEFVKILNSHPAIAVGMERFKYALSKQNVHEFDRSMFRPENFFRFDQSQTNILPSSPAWASFYDDLREKSDAGSIKYVGDKVPFLFRVFDQLDEEFPSARWLFTTRPLEEVARSYDRRAADPDDHWPTENDHRLAKRHWDEAEAALDRMRRVAGDRVLEVPYQTLFAGSQDCLDEIVTFLNLERSETMCAYLKETTAGWEQRRLEKGR